MWPFETCGCLDFMNVDFDKTYYRLADTIAEILSEKIQAGPDVVEYIDSIVGDADIEQVQSLIKDNNSTERESLVELIFFPDTAIQVQLEEMLPANGCTSAGVAAVAAELASRNITATVPLGDTGRALDVRVDRTVIDPFLTRLNLDYAADAELDRTMAEVLPVSQRLEAKVRFRNAQIQPAGRLRDFLQRYMRAMCKDSFFFEGLDFLLAFVQETGGSVEMYEALTAKKRNCWRHLKKSEGIEDRIRKTNVETMLLQGERLPYIDRTRMLRTIAAVDRICLAVYGRTEVIESIDSNDSDWEIRDREDAVEMIRRLSS